MTASSAGRMWTVAAFLALAFRFDVALACSSPPPHMYIPHQEAIADADWIARVRGLSIDRERVRGRAVFRLEVLEYLKGEGPDIIEIESLEIGLAGDDARFPNEANYHGHRASEFWTGTGRYFNSADCRVHPGFLLGGNEYLVFGDRDYTQGFENITGETDLWYQFVRDSVRGDGPANRPFPVTIEDYLHSAAAIVRITANWTGLGLTIETQILKGPSLPYAHLLHVSPEAHYAGLMNPVCQSGSDSQSHSQRRRVDRLIVFEFLPNDQIYLSELVPCDIPGREGSGRMAARGEFSRTGHRSFAIRNGQVQMPASAPLWLDLGRERPELSLDVVLSMIHADH